MTIFRLVSELRALRAEHDVGVAWLRENYSLTTTLAEERMHYEIAVGRTITLWLELDRKMSWLQRWVGWDPRAR